jgi:glycosyltransferase involved in cell wall biosynthesis
MSDEPLVAITIPTYRRLDMLREAIESALGQTYRNRSATSSADAVSSSSA